MLCVKRYNYEQRMEQLFGHDTRIQSVLEQAGDFSRSNSAAEAAGCFARDKKSLLRDVVERSKKTGVWIPDISGIVDKVIGYGQENDVFLSVDGMHVVKLNNFALVPAEATSFEGFVHRLLTHNKLFPECAYTILGYTYNADHEPCAILRQPFIKACRYATDEEIDTFLEDKGYTVDMDDIWFDGRYEISDVKSSNVLVDHNGNLHFIDAVVNDTKVNVSKVNKVSIKHPNKRKT